MSKVKNYMDGNKEKARHRNRIDETRRTKANRIRKCNNWTYSWLRGGYYHKTERVAQIIKSPNGRIIKTVPVSILKRGSTRRAKYFKTQAKRRHRRKTRIVDEESYLLKGNTYKKDYDIQWRIW